jgi:hypothetical protein
MTSKPLRPRRPRYVVCISNAGYPASLEVRKLYATLPDAHAAKLGMVRVVDESGEDYLYPRDRFASLVVPARVADALAAR